jgi:hypothetical protein
MKPTGPRPPNPLARLGKAPPKPAKPKSSPKAAPPLEVKSDPFAEPEPITQSINPAARASRLVGRWNGLSPDRKKLVEQYIAALEITQSRERAR